jgi:tetratricopeptide (TPR) repeat protein
LKQALETVVLLELDAEAGEGQALAEEYGVKGFPTFIVTNAEGEQIDRWWGYDEPEAFVAELDEAKADPTTVEQKIARFEADPSEQDAATLGSIFATRGEPGKAVAYYRRAEELAGPGNGEYAMPLFTNTYLGHSDEELFPLEEVRAAADAVLASETSDAGDVLIVAYRMAGLAQKNDDPTLLEPYAGPALEAGESVEEESLERLHRNVRIAKALVLDQDPERAVALKKESMPDGWKDDPDQLNEFAWWCFENEVNLAEAEQMARKGVELAEPGSQRARILDTVAEICNLRGKCEEAVSLMARAVEDDPDNEHYQSQLERFEQRLEEGCA